MAVAIASLAATGCRANDSGAAPPQRVDLQLPIGVLPHNALDAALAGTRQHLWLAVTGRDGSSRGEPIRVRVAQFDVDQKWKEIAGPKNPLDEGSPLSLALTGGEPCLGYASSGRPVVACLTAGQWAFRSNWVPEATKGHLIELASLHGVLYALFKVEPGARQSSTVMYRGRIISAGRARALGLACNRAAMGPTRCFRDARAAESALQPSRRTRATPTPSAFFIVRWSRGRWRQLGDAIAAPGSAVAAFEEDAPGALPEVVLTALEGANALRRVWTYQDGSWRRLSKPLAGAAGGPQLSGPLRADGRLLVPVVDASRTPWRFVVFLLDRGRWRRLAGRSLSSGAGSAQGTLSYAAGEVWAIWQENGTGSRRGFSTAIYATRLPLTGARVSERLRLWHGLSPGPGAVHVAAGAGAVWALYMRPPVGDVSRLEPAISRLARAPA